MRRLSPPCWTVDPITGCWNWRWNINGNGYGRITANGRRYIASRFLFEWMRGQMPTKYEPDHLCRNKRCVNPDHLEAVPHAVNAQRRSTSTLTPEIVLRIKRMIDSGMQKRCIAHTLNIPESQVYRISYGLRWRNIQ